MIYGKIVGTGKYLPETILTNKDLEKMVDTTDEWIYSRTGIRNRRIATNDTNYEMAVKAGKEAIKSAGINPVDIDMIVVATMSSEFAFPSVGCLVQKEIGADNAMCFDLSAAWSGFIFALNTVNQYIVSGAVKTALIIGVEKLSHLLDWTDRNTCVLFGDGAGAAVVCASDEPGIIGVECKSVGSQYECLQSRVKRVKTPFYEPEKYESLKMEGREVFQFACTQVPECIARLLEKENVKKEEVDYYVLHQANIRIIKKIAKVLKEDINKFFINMENYGNTSAASVAIALDEFYKSNDLKGKQIVMAGFGAGLTYGATIIKF